MTARKGSIRGPKRETIPGQLMSGEVAAITYNKILERLAPRASPGIRSAIFVAGSVPLPYYHLQFSSFDEGNEPGIPFLENVH